MDLRGEEAAKAMMRVPVPIDELWDPSQTRLTVLFDPARIKRGLVPNAQLGLPLRAGRRYRLEIDSAWPDAQGVALSADS